MSRTVSKMTAVIIGGNGLRYEKDLQQHFFWVAFWNIFPHCNETEASRKKWAHRIINEKEKEDDTDSGTVVPLLQPKVL